MVRADRAKRRSWPTPLGVVLLTLATSIALPLARWGDSALVLALVPAAIAGYLAGRRMVPLVPAVVTFGVVLAVSLPVSYLMPGTAPLGDWMASVLIALLTVVAPWWFGRYRMLREEQRESDAAILADRAQAEERARIADDLHDTIGHELALIAVQAGALELGREPSPEQRERFRELREAAVRASSRLRDVVQMTRGDDGSSRLDPPGGEGIDALVARAREAGMTVGSDIDHTAIAGVHPLIAELAVRTVREGLTNAARHAPGAAVDLGVARDGGAAIIVHVRSGLSAGGAAQGGGHGIPSLRRRAELLGADITAGADGGGFELRLRAPARPLPPEQDTTGAADLALRSNAQTARRRVLQAAIVPLVIVALALVGFLVVQAVTVAQTAISSAVYDEIRIGSTREALASLLPAGTPEPVPVVAEPPGARGAGVRVLRRAGRLAAFHGCDRPPVLRGGRAGREASAGGDMIRVLIADDEAMMRAGVRAILESDPEIEVVFEAANGREAIDGTQRHRPDVAVLDIRMPGLDGLGAAEEIAATVPGTRVVMLTTFGEDDYVQRALGGGALGFLLKAADPRELVAGVHAVAAGGAYLSPDITRRVIAPYRGIDRALDGKARESVSALTDREREVLALLGAGASNAEIGERLHLVEGTVKGYVSAILVKLDVRNRVEAAIVAHRAGIAAP